MLRPTLDSHPTSPSTTHNDLSDHGDHGSFSTHSTPPLQFSPPKVHSIHFAIPPEASKVQVSPSKSSSISQSSELLEQARPAAPRHISFGGVAAVPDARRTSSIATPHPDATQDHSGEATPVARKTIQFASHAEMRVTSDASQSTSDECARPAPRTRSIKFAASGSQTRSSENSRRSSYNEGHLPSASGDDGVRTTSTNVSGASSPLLTTRPFLHATCKSTLEAMLKKEAIAKVIDTVAEEDEDDEEDEAEHEDGDEDDLGEDADEEEEEAEEDEEGNSMSALNPGSDDDGYEEDIESDEDLSDADIYPQLAAGSDTPRRKFLGQIDPRAANTTPNQAVQTPVFRTAAPSESDLPDTTDFAPGTIDEDQPACIAFDMAVRDREARRRPAKPSDIDPTFPESGSEDDFDDLDDADIPAAKVNENGKLICRSPPMLNRTGRQRWNSPPLARAIDTSRARSLPRRYLTGRKALYEPKPQRAVTIKQSNERRAERRREKKEVRHNLRRGKAGVDHNGHEKMKVHCLSRKKLIANENPCVIRPIMSI